MPPGLNIPLPSLAQRVRRYRQRNNITMREAAKQAGNIGSATICRIEAGKPPSFDTFLRLCRWMQLTGDDLLELVESEVDDA